MREDSWIDHRFSPSYDSIKGEMQFHLRQHTSHKQKEWSISFRLIKLDYISEPSTKESVKRTKVA